MKMKKKRNGVLLLLAAVMVLITACGGNAGNPKSSTQPDQAEATKQPIASQPGDDPFGKFPEPVILTVGQSIPPNDNSLPANDTLENNQYTRRIKEVTNVEIKVGWSAVNGAAYNQKVKLAISSNDLPDAMLVSREDLELLVKSDLIADLTEAYDRFASPLLKKIHDSIGGKALVTATFNGKLMALPNAVPQGDGVNLVWIRKDWLDKLTLPEPKTIEDLEQTIQAFIEKDPGGNGKGKNLGIVGDKASLNAIFAAYHSYPGIWHTDKEGKAVWGSTTPETKRALQKLQDMYKKGLIDREIGLRKDPAEPIIAGQTGVFLAPWWAPWGALGDATVNDPKAEWIPLAMPVDSDGAFNTQMAPVSSLYIVVRKGYEHLDAVLKANNVRTNADLEASLYDLKVNAAYWPLRALTAPLGVEDMYNGVTKALNGEIKPEDLPADQKDTYDRYMRVKESPGKIDLTDWAPVKSYLLGGSAVMKPMNKVYPVYSAETKTMKLKWPALSKMEEEVFYKIIMNEQSVDTFDKFVEDWNKMGGAEITKEVQEAIK